MFSVFSYGSLMNPEDIEDTFGSDVSCTPCILQGFKRHYGQKSEWRTDKNGDRAGVLTVSPDHTKRPDNTRMYCNGILVRKIDEHNYDTYKDRERGYQLVKIGSELVSTMEGESIAISKPIVIPIGAWSMEEWIPLESYMQHCEEGARYWGENFYNMFCDTTYKTRLSMDKPHD